MTKQKYLFLYFLVAIMACMSVNAKMINGIAMIVNNQIITIEDIKQAQKQKDISKEESINYLIDKAIFNQEVQNYNIEANDIDIQNKLKIIHNKHDLTLKSFQKVVENKGENWSEYKENIRENIIRQKLRNAILMQKIGKPDENTIKRFYEKNIDRFSIPEKIEAIKYTSKNRQSLEKKIQNPHSKSIKDISSQKETIDLRSLHSNVAQVFSNAKTNNFIPILSPGDHFATYFIVKKINPKQQKLEDIENFVSDIYMMEQGELIIIDHFEKLKANALINKIR